LLFWLALACGGIVLLGLLGVGAFLGLGYLKSKGPLDAARAQLKDIASGDLKAAYSRTCANYQSGHSAAAFAAFVGRHPGLKGNTNSTFRSSVEDNGATLSGTLTHAAGTENVVYNLVKEGGLWKVAGIDVDGDEGAVPPAADNGPKVETVAVDKVPRGQTVVVTIEVRVTGFSLRPEGNLFRVDLVEDLETLAPNGTRIDELSRVGLQSFNQTSSSATGAAATFKTSLTFAKPDPGAYKAIITIRDLVGGLKSSEHEVAFNLP
jgi:hypothetical protein